MSKNIVCFLAPFVALFLTVSAAAGENRTYLALGDSITTGYQPTGIHLADGKFASIIAARLGLELDNEAVDGNTAAGISSQLQGGTLDLAIASASLITITVGGNDLMAALYAEVAAIYNERYGSTSPINASDVPTILANSSDTRYFNVLMSAYSVLTAGNFAETSSFTATLASFTVSFTNVVTYIRARNPSAPLVIETQYNPYKWMGTGSVQVALSNASDAGAKKLNAVISAPANGAGTLYRVADVYTAFAGSSDNLCCATPTLSSLDFHPNPAGHAVIAATMLDTLCLVSSVTVNGGVVSMVGGGAGAAVWGYDGTNLVLDGAGPYEIGGSNGVDAVRIHAAADCSLFGSNLVIDVSTFAGLSALDAGGHTVTISGGTLVFAGGSGAADISGAVDITGGSVRLKNGTFSVAPSNGLERVWCVAVGGLAPNARSVVSGLPAAYGADGLFADVDGNVYLWLPNGGYAFVAAGGLKAATVAGGSATAVDAPLVITGYDGESVVWSPSALSPSAVEFLYSASLTNGAVWSAEKPAGAPSVFLKLRVK